jgi:hypothetical protein
MPGELGRSASHGGLMPEGWLRRPNRCRIERLSAVLLAVALGLLWAVVLHPLWATTRGASEPTGGYPALAARATKPS